MSDELEHELWAADLQDAEDQITEAFGDTRAPQQVDGGLVKQIKAEMQPNNPNDASPIRTISTSLMNQIIDALQQQPGQVVVTTDSRGQAVEALVKRIDKWLNRSFQSSDPEAQKANHLLQQARDAIPVWRSVSKSLPDFDAPVLCTFGDGSVHAMSRYYENDQGWYWVMASGWGSDLTDVGNFEADDEYEPTMWMPLPVPPADEVSEC